jgi:hypothetical protein
MIEVELTDDAQLRRARLLVEGHDGDRIAEDVVQPAHAPGLGIDDEARREEAQVVAVARPEHHPVRTERHRIGIAVRRGVPDVQERHRAD